MTNKILAIALTAALFTSACGNNQEATETENVTTQAVAQPTETDVPFVVAQNYFVRNDYQDKELHSLKITTQADFDNVFGMAATMGANGQPTALDFSKQYVIACIAPTSDTIHSLEAGSLKKSGDTLTLTYKQTDGEKRSFTSRYAILLIVGNEYQGEVKLQRQ